MGVCENAFIAKMESCENALLLQKELNPWNGSCTTKLASFLATGVLTSLCLKTNGLILQVIFVCKQTLDIIIVWIEIWH